MEYLYGRNRAVAADGGAAAGDGAAPAAEGPDQAISAAGRHVVVIGGGDTGADCVGNAVREGAASIVQLELLPEPPARRPDDRTPWPLWPAKFRLSYAMEEARAVQRGRQDFSVVTTRLGGADGRVQALHYARAEPAPPFGPVAGTEGQLPADLVLLAMGFVHPEHAGIVDQFGVALDARGNVRAGAYETTVPGVFAAGDARRGQSLIVWAINEGRQCARMVDRYLHGLDHTPPQAVLVGGGEADEGPEGPPRLAGPAL
jgi:glutamate synthase (NADPH/NADH) small chain